MQTKIMDRLFLELSQVTQATTAKEISLQQEINTLKKELRDINKALDDPRVDVTITMAQKILELKKERKEETKLHPGLFDDLFKDSCL